MAKLRQADVELSKGLRGTQESRNQQASHNPAYALVLSTMRDDFKPINCMWRAGSDGFAVLSGA